MKGRSDDPSILDPDPLWRRIHPLQVVPDGRGGSRVSSAAMTDSSDGTGMSVTLGREAQAAGVTPALALSRHPGLGLASLLAGECRRQSQILARDPTPDDPHHALVEGEKPKAVQRALARAATLLVWPPPSSDP